MDKVIALAAIALEQHVVPWEAPEAWSATAAEAAIKAADAARAEDVKAAVERFMKCCIIYGGNGDGTGNDEKNAARRDLFALLGITESASGE